MNPPYGRQIKNWVKKAYLASLEGATVVCLVPARTDTYWWHTYVRRAQEIRFIRGRLKFGGCRNSAPFPSAIAVFRPPTCTPGKDQAQETGSMLLYDYAERRKDHK
jgi:site-specific DNA-methyltransferase (adenine-specific)